MSFALRIKFHSYRFSFSIVLVLLVLSGMLTSALWKSTEARIPAESSQEQRAVTQLESEIITITPTGFEPSDITRPKGPFILAVDNRSGLENVQLYFERDTGSRLNLSLSHSRKLAWSDKVDLPAGRYLLRSANDESWRCRITVMP